MGAHNIQVDAEGTVWLTAEDSEAIVEINFDQPGGQLNSRSGRAIVHSIPHDLGGGAAGAHFHVHGLTIVVDQRTGQRYVYVSDAENNGRTALLIPGRAGGEDRWLEWQFSPAIDDRGINAAGTLESRPTGSGHALFLAVDDRETPGVPEDDRLVFADGGRPGGTFTYGSVRLLEVGPLIQSLQRTGGLPEDGVSTHLRTVQIPEMPSSTPTATQFASTVQAFVDREANVFFLDTRSGVGRFNPDDPLLVSDNRQVVVRSIHPDETPLVERSLTMVNAAGAPQGTQNPFSTLPQTTITPLTSAINSTDNSAMRGVDQYQLSRPPTRGGRTAQPGPFRGALNAGSVLSTSLAQSDHLSTTVFAETVRRQMDVVVRTENPANGLTVGRMAFSVRRDGSLIATVRADGSILDEQVNASQLASGGMLEPNHLFAGDPSAVVNQDTGIVTIFGINQNNRLAIIRFNGGANGWTNEEFANSGNWSSEEALPPAGSLLVGDPTAFLSAAGQAGAIATSEDGDLLLYSPLLGPTMIDVNAAGSPVYSSVAILNSLAPTNQLFVYGTNQKGQLLQFQFSDNVNPGALAGTVIPTGNASDRGLMVFQDVYAASEGTTRHVFAVDGNARLVHFEIDPDSGTFVENVTEAVQSNNRVFGYFPFQQSPETRYGGRVYSGLAADVGADGQIFVYGTNGGELIEFKRSPAGIWQAANLTNDIYSTSGHIIGPDRGGSGEAPAQRVPANAVFGAPSAYLLPNGQRHVVQINADGEVVEYYYQEAGQQYGRFQTQNITLRLSPSGANDVYRTAPGQPLVVTPNAGVLANDTNPSQLDNPPQMRAFQLSAPANGTVAFNDDGSFTYTPRVDFTGADSFLYQARTEFGESPAIQVTIIVAPAEVGTIIDDGRPGYSQKGSWSNRADATSFQNDFRESTAGRGNDVATWTFGKLPAGEYEVFTRWNVSASRASNAPYSIFDDKKLVGGQTIDQRQAAEGEVAAGFVWKSLGTVSIESGTLKVTLSDRANGSVSADAVRVVRRSLATTLDDGMSGYSQRGSWQTRRSNSAVGGDFRESARGTGKDVAEWRFTELPDGQYEVFTHWVAGSNRATNAPYSVFDNNTRLSSQNVNQKIAPTGQQFGGFNWHSLGTVTVTSGVLKVTLTDKANGAVIADAVRIAPASGTPLQAIDLALLSLMEPSLTGRRK